MAQEKGPKRDYTIYFPAVIAIILIVSILILNRQKNISAFNLTLTPDSNLTPDYGVTYTPVFMLPTDTPTPAPKLLRTNTLDIIYTNTSFPTPGLGVIILNGPESFRVESWDDDDAKCGFNVTIYGVIISHGISPYTFTFWSPKEPFKSYTPVIKQVILLKHSRDYVEFIPPVVVVKGRYTHVELNFQRKDGKKVTWIDDLFYSYPDETCH